MKSLFIYFILTFISLQYQAQENNEIIKGEWILSSLKVEPYFNWNNDFAFTDVLSDSAIKLNITDKTIEIIVLNLTSYDTSNYSYSLSVDTCFSSFHLNLYQPSRKKRKKNKYANTVTVNKLNNSGMLIHLGHFDYSSPFFNYSSTQYYFKKTVTESNTINEKTIEGNWFISDTTNFYAMDTIKLKRDSCIVKTKNFDYRVTINFHTSIDELDCFSYDKSCLNCSVLSSVYISPCTSWKINPSISEMKLIHSSGRTIRYKYKFDDNQFMMTKQK